MNGFLTVVHDPPSHLSSHQSWSYSLLPLPLLLMYLPCVEPHLNHSSPFEPVKREKNRNTTLQSQRANSNDNAPTQLFPLDS